LADQQRGIKGALCETPADLRRTARGRKNKHDRRRVPNNELDVYFRQNWRCERRGKHVTTVERDKRPDECFEDEVWLLFHALGFQCLNQDRNCKLQFGTYPRQVDVLAKDGDLVFIVECKSTEAPKARSAKDALEKFVAQHDEIRKALCAHFGREDVGRVCHVVALSSDEKRPKDRQYVNNHRDKNLFLWSRQEIEYMKALASQVGSVARHQLYSVLFAEKKQKSLAKRFPALRAQAGSRLYYSFLARAKELAPYAYVHHRRLTDVVSATQAYQRMLKRAKLKQIRQYIDEEDGSFPNSVVLNFTKPLQWEGPTRQDVAVGKVTLPAYYGCAWVIDGQHRLYGAASAKEEAVLPVIAFQSIPEGEQAALFVDINKKQTSVPGGLLWDLYSDIYEGSDDRRQHRLCQISKTSKCLSQQGPLHDKIDIESKPATGSAPLKLTTVCTTIERYARWEYLKDERDDTKTPTNAARLIRTYFSALKDLWPEDWKRGKGGVLLSNNGFGVFVMIFGDLIHHLKSSEQMSLLRGAGTTKLESFFSEHLMPPIRLLQAKANIAADVKTLTGRGPQSMNAACLEAEIHKRYPSLHFPRLQTPTAQRVGPSKPLTVEGVGQLAKDAERLLREFVKERLQELHGTRWWKVGVPGHTKERLHRKWHDEATRDPSMRADVSGDANERKLDYTTLFDLVDIIKIKGNWEGVFAERFYSVEELSQRIKRIAGARDPTAHSRELRWQASRDAEPALCWLSGCLADPSIDPYPHGDT